MKLEKAFATTATVAKHQNKEARSCLLDPKKSVWLGHWDSIGALTLIFTAAWTPVEVAFVPPPTDWRDGLFLANRLIDVYFAVDMALQFFLLVPRPPDPVEIRVQDDEAILRNSPGGTSWEGSKFPHGAQSTRGQSARSSNTARQRMTQGEISVLYLQTWFLLDLVSVLTCLIDIIPIAMAAQSGAAGNLRMLRVLRALRLIKLARLLKSSRIYERWKSYIDLSFSAQTMITCMIKYAHAPCETPHLARPHTLRDHTPCETPRLATL